MECTATVLRHAWLIFARLEPDPCPEGIGCDEANDVCNMPTVVISPGSLMQSRWMPMLLFLRVQGTDTHFGAGTEVTYTPGGIVALPMVANQETMFCLGHAYARMDHRTDR